MSRSDLWRIIYLSLLNVREKCLLRLKIVGGEKMPFYQPMWIPAKYSIHLITTYKVIVLLLQTIACERLSKYYSAERVYIHIHGRAMRIIISGMHGSVFCYRRFLEFAFWYSRRAHDIILVVIIECIICS